MNGAIVERLEDVRHQIVEAEAQRLVDRLDLVYESIGVDRAEEDLDSIIEELHGVLQEESSDTIGEDYMVLCQTYARLHLLATRV